MSAKIPPSPLLSARMMKVTYLTDTTKIAAQKIRDKIPMIVGKSCASL